MCPTSFLVGATRGAPKERNPQMSNASDVVERKQSASASIGRQSNRTVDEQCMLCDIKFKVKVSSLLCRRLRCIVLRRAGNTEPTYSFDPSLAIIGLSARQ